MFVGNCSRKQIKIQNINAKCESLHRRRTIVTIKVGACTPGRGSDSRTKLCGKKKRQALTFARRICRDSHLAEKRIGIRSCAIINLSCTNHHPTMHRSTNQHLVMHQSSARHAPIITRPCTDQPISRSCTNYHLVMRQSRSDYAPTNQSASGHASIHHPAMHQSSPDHAPTTQSSSGHAPIIIQSCTDQPISIRSCINHILRSCTNRHPVKRQSSQ